MKRNGLIASAAVLAAATLLMSTGCSTRSPNVTFYVLDGLDIIYVPRGSVITLPTGTNTVTVKKDGYYASSNYWYRVAATVTKDGRDH